MMRRLSAGLLLAMIFTVPGRAQDALPVKYWVFFDGKDAAKTVEADHLTERALERRQRRGTLAVSALDAPLMPAHLVALERLGVDPLIESRWLNAASAFLDDDQLEAVLSLPFVREVRPVGVTLRKPLPPSDDGSAAPYAAKTLALNYGASFTQLELMNDVSALEAGINGTGVILGFLDTEYGGFTHPVFQKLVNEGRLLGVQNFAQGEQANRHGMSVASVAVGFDEGNLIGPAYGAGVYAATTEYAPTETNQEEDNFVAGLEWLEAQGVDVVNTSLGYTEFDAGQQSYTYADLDGDTGVTTRAVDIAASLGVVVVTSAGNEGISAWHFIGTPADADSIITVGAVRSDSTKAGFSSFGPTADGRIKPDVAAMGTNVMIATGVNTYTLSNGTSFASPLVAGVVCQILQVNPDLNPIDIRNILRWTASQSQNPNNELGWGIVNAAAAIDAASKTQTGTESGDLPVSLTLSAHPNPFTRHATFEVNAASPGTARLEIFDVLGRRVAIPFDGRLHTGVNRLLFEDNGLPPGLYLYRLTAEGTTISGTLVRRQ